MTEVIDQPPPVSRADRRPAWDIVIEYVAQHRDANAYGACGVIDIVLDDMRARDRIGRERYSVPLTSGNGRDHIIDAVQESFDLVVYLAAELDERGVGPETVIDDAVSADPRARWQTFCLQQLFASQVRSLIQLRALIEERTQAS